MTTAPRWTGPLASTGASAVEAFIAKYAIELDETSRNKLRGLVRTAKSAKEGERTLEKLLSRPRLSEGVPLPGKPSWTRYLPDLDELDMKARWRARVPSVEHVPAELHMLWTGVNKVAMIIIKEAEGDSVKQLRGKGCCTCCRSWYCQDRRKVEVKTRQKRR